MIRTMVVTIGAAALAAATEDWVNVTVYRTTPINVSSSRFAKAPCLEHAHDPANEPRRLYSIQCGKELRRITVRNCAAHDARRH